MKDQGDAAERLAEQYLVRAGLKLVTRNFRCRLGEIDLIMQDGDTLVFLNDSERGSGRYTYRFDGRDRYHFRIENKFPGQADFCEFMRGDYRRA